MRLDTMKLKLAMQSRFDAQNKSKVSIRFYSTLKTCKDPSTFLKKLTNGQPICDRPHPAGAPEDVSLRLAAVHQQVAPRQRLDAQLLCAALQRRGPVAMALPEAFSLLGERGLPAADPQNYR